MLKDGFLACADMQFRIREDKCHLVFVLAALLLTPVSSPGWSHAMQLGQAEIEVEPYLKGGTIAWDQLRGIGGHKFLIGAGLNTHVAYRSVGTTINFEKWWVAEGLDDDEGIVPKEGYSVATDFKYFFKTNSLTLYPFAGLGFDRWADRNSPTSWNSLQFASWRVGLGLDNERGYFRAGILKPFVVSADRGADPTSRYGFIADGGIRVAAFTVGLFFKYVGFQDPDDKMVQTGLFLAYTFK